MGRSAETFCGIAIGEEQTKRAFIASMLANGRTLDDIVRLTSLPLAEGGE